MGIPARQPRGTSAGGRFAPHHHAEAPVALYGACFAITNKDHVEMACGAVIEARLYGNDSTDAALDAIEAACERHGMEPPPRLTILFSASLSNIVQNQWPSDEPDELDCRSDRVGNPGPTWKGVGLTPADAARWTNAGVPGPAVARRLCDAGLTPAVARAIFSDSDEGGDPIRVGEAVSHGAISVEQARVLAGGHAVAEQAIGF